MHIPRPPPPQVQQVHMHQRTQMSDAINDSLTQNGSLNRTEKKAHCSPLPMDEALS